MNNNVVILHRHDVHPSYLHIKIEELAIEHFKINDSYLTGCLFLAFEENGLFKILVNDGGNCALIPTASFMMAVDMCTNERAMNPFKKDVMESKEIPLPDDFSFNGITVGKSAKLDYVIGIDDADPEGGMQTIVIFKTDKLGRAAKLAFLYNGPNQDAFMEALLGEAKKFGIPVIKEED